MSNPVRKVVHLRAKGPKGEVLPTGGATVVIDFDFAEGKIKAGLALTYRGGKQNKDGEVVAIKPDQFNKKAGREQAEKYLAEADTKGRHYIELNVRDFYPRIQIGLDGKKMFMLRELISNDYNEFSMERQHIWTGYFDKASDSIMKHMDQALKSFKLEDLSYQNLTEGVLETFVRKHKVLKRYV